MTQHRRFRPLPMVLLAAAIVACDSGTVADPGGPSPNLNLDAQVRQAIAGWGVVPILPVKAQDPALVDLGRSLFFDKILSGNRDVSCATCHSPLTNSGDGRSLAVGTGALIAGGTRTVGPGRQFTPRNAPSLFNSALGLFYIFWDGRVSEEFGPGRFVAPTTTPLPAGVSGLVAAQAMLPVLDRVEMRGLAGDRDIAGNANELAVFSDSQKTEIWNAAMRRVLSIAQYQQQFNAAFPGVTASQLGFQHAANAIAAFETQTFSKTNSDFDRYLARNDNALSLDAKRGALLFFGGRAQCSSCHNGPLLGGQSFANGGVPQLGPGTGAAAPLDAGREDVFFGSSKPVGPGVGLGFTFRVPPLRNVELSAPYMHNGAYGTLEAVVRHYNNVDSALKSFDPSSLEPALRASYHGDATTIANVFGATDGRLRFPLRLTNEEQMQLVAFLKSLTDPSARNMGAVIPASVPSGLAVK